MKAFDIYTPQKHLGYLLRFVPNMMLDFASAAFFFFICNANLLFVGFFGGKLLELVKSHSQDASFNLLPVKTHAHVMTFYENFDELW